MLKRVLKVLRYGATLVLMLAAAGLLVAVVPVFGNEALIVRSGSMAPAIGVGDLVVAREQAGGYRVGQVIAFESGSDSSVVFTHRVIEVLGEGEGASYVTKGDANEQPDEMVVTSNLVLGRQVLTVPQVGRLLALGKTKTGWLAFIVLPTLLIIIGDVAVIRQELQSGRRASTSLPRRWTGRSSSRGRKCVPEWKAWPLAVYKMVVRRVHIGSATAKTWLLILFTGLMIPSGLALYTDSESSVNNVFKAADYSNGSGVPNVDRALAFPGAAGFGAYAQGGRGGDVYHVTNLNNSGAGSLREGIDTAEGPRTIVFDVSGTIELSARLYIREPYLTIAGQTAPGDGITISRFGMRIIDTHDVVIRYLRLRTGDIVAAEHDTLLVYRSNNVIIDHVSASWSVDETVPTNHSSDVTVQWSFITEGLDDSHHSKGPHSAGNIHYDGSLSLHHNLFAHNATRNPLVQQQADVVNNVIYNWSRLGATIGRYDEDPFGPTYVNFQNNYYIAGPSTIKPYWFYYIHPGAQFWPSGIYFDNNRNGVLDGTLVEPWPSDSRTVSSRFDYPVVPTDDTLTAYARVLAEAGASLQRDAVDERLVDDVVNQTGQVIDSQDEVGGWPELNSTAPAPDSDRDGMSDQWEDLFDYLDPHDPSDGVLDHDGDGYTNLDDYLAAVADQDPRLE